MFTMSWRNPTCACGSIIASRSFSGNRTIAIFPTLLSREALVKPIFLWFLRHRLLIIWVHASKYHFIFIVLVWRAHFKGALIYIPVKRFIINKLRWPIWVFVNISSSGLQHILCTLHITIYLFISNFTNLWVKLFIVLLLLDLQRPLVNIWVLWWWLVSSWVTSSFHIHIVFYNWIK